MNSIAVHNELQKGVSFLTDNKGIKRWVVFDLTNKDVQELMEDLFDTITATNRLNEPASNFAQVKKRILRQKQIQ